MKIFFATRMIDSKVEMKIVKEDNSWIGLQGEKCTDLTPNYGVKLDDGEEQKLKEWLNEWNNYCEHDWINAVYCNRCLKCNKVQE